MDDSEKVGTLTLLEDLVMVLLWVGTKSVFIKHHLSESLRSDDSSVNTNEQWIQPWFQNDARFRPSAVLIFTNGLVGVFWVLCIVWCWCYIL